MRSRLAVANHRGELVPRSLGIVLLGGLVLATAVSDVAGDVHAAGWGVAAGCALVALAGLVDDLAGGAERGLRGHLRALARGRVTTGVVKAVVIAGAAAVVAALLEDRSVGERAAAIVTMAASANLWNGLDVRPGRALKAFVIPASAFLLGADVSAQPAILGVVLAAVAALPFDLRERAMLGDAGSNLLGFAAGVVVVELLDGAWLGLAGLVLVALNVVAETVSFSRVIERIAPLRWVDGLGRRV